MDIKYKIVISLFLTIISSIGAIIAYDNWLVGYITGGLLMASVIWTYNDEGYKSMFK